MQHLEDDFGVPLFERKSNHIELTETGLKAVEQARIILTGLIRPAFLKIGKMVFALCVHQVKIKIGNAAGFKLAFKKRADIFLFFEEEIGQLIRFSSEGAYSQSQNYFLYFRKIYFPYFSINNERYSNISSTPDIPFSS
jgi:hypothetical protein